MSQETRDAILALLQRQGIAYGAVFVPQSASRNSGAKDHTLNWRVSFSNRDGRSFALDYQQGIGHIPGYKQPRTVYDVEQLGQPWETGKYKAHPTFGGGRNLPAPSPADVLYSIVLDNPHEASFEDWAADFGYDTDSRKAEATYRACIEQSRMALRVLGRELLDEAAKLLEGY